MFSSEENHQDMKIEASCLLLTVINLPLLKRSPVSHDQGKHVFVISDQYTGSP